MSRFGDFLADYPPSQLDQVRRIKVVDGGYSELMRKYEALLVNDSDYGVDFVRNNKNITEIFSSQEINLLLQGAQQYDNQFYSKKTGVIISCLIQNSYRGGQNQFLLNTQSLPRIDFMSSHLMGARNKDLVITNQGDVGNYFGYKALFSSFIVNSKTGDFCGFNAYESTFILNGEVGGCCGIGARLCTFKTPILNNLEEMKQTVLSDYKESRRNTLIYIDNGKEVEISRW